MKLFRRFTALMLAVTLSLTTFAAAARDWAAVEVADKAGATVKGIVYAGDEPLRGVAVSDGAEIVFTDAEGRYWLPTDKRSGSVFITIPSGYEVSADGVFPRFWAALEAPAKEVERHDFALTKVDNDRHVMLAVTDIHLSNQNSDIEQFCTRFIPDVRAVAESFGDTPVYSLNMGDSAWDGYWYTNRYSLKDFRRTMNIVGYPAQMFCAMGNHDNDGATIHSDSVDWAASAPYRRIIGPRYYSFNIGKVHYVVLDNLIYVNSPKKNSKDGIAGKRDYVRRVDSLQLDWLRRDLATVEDKSAPVVVAMHAATYRYNKFNDKVTAGLSDPAYSAELKACFDGFEEVHYVSGHIHKNLLARVDDRLIEHNIGAVCGSWWRTGANHFQMLGPDAGPNGYAIFTIDGKRMQWTYRSIEDGDKQFRAYDMNELLHRVGGCGRVPRSLPRAARLPRGGRRQPRLHQRLVLGTRMEDPRNRKRARTARAARADRRSALRHLVRHPAVGMEGQVPRRLRQARQAAYALHGRRFGACDDARNRGDRLLRQGLPRDDGTSQGVRPADEIGGRDG